uniref:Uncharacterized protein n=1 Tax=Arundo donax TaxID=35708 RepID=A0A0A9BVG8_ARUDO
MPLQCNLNDYTCVLCCWRVEPQFLC